MKLTHQANPVRVRAAEIVSIGANAISGAFIATLSDGRKETLDLNQVARHFPVPGDYVVEQEDGYVYVNPKDVFERKYSVITPE